MGNLSSCFCGAKVAAAVLFAAGSVLGLATQASAAFQYLDTNSTTPGTTNSTAQQTWNSSAAVWTTDPTGSIATTTYVDGLTTDVVLSAEDPAGVNNASLAYNLSTGGAKSSNSITIRDGTVTIAPTTTPPTRTIGGGGITLASTAGGQFTIASSAGGITLVLAASQTWTDNHASAAFVVNNAANATTGLDQNKIFGNAPTGTTYTLTTAANGTGNVSIAAPISDGTVGGNVAFATVSSGTGATVLSGVNTFTGGTTVSKGTLLLDNGGSLAHSNITITGGSFGGGTTTNATSGVTGGTIVDNVVGNVSELISLSGTGVIDLTHLNLTVAATGTQTLAEYVLANASVGSSNVTGTSFATTNLPAGWTISYTGTAAHPGDIVLLTSSAAVPEPASLGVLALGAVGLIRRRR